MQRILQYLKVHGDRLDSEIAAETGIPLRNVRLWVSELAARREVVMCHTTRFIEGEKVEGMLCRVAGYIPPASPGRKAKAQTLA